MDIIIYLLKVTENDNGVITTFDLKCFTTKGAALDFVKRNGYNYNYTIDEIPLEDIE